MDGAVPNRDIEGANKRDYSRKKLYVIPTFLNDTAIGRPLVIRNAYGTSIPHLDINDVKKIRIPRLGEASENRIADLMDESVRLSAEADRMENEVVQRAQEQIDLTIGATPAE